MMTGNENGEIASVEPSGSRERLVVLGILLAGAVLRLAHLFTLHDVPFFSILYIDPLMYDEWGQRIAAGQLFSERPFFLDPLYPYFLGLIYAIFGHHYIAVAAVQSLLGIAVPLLVFHSTRTWFDMPTATTAGVIAAVYVPAVYFGGLIMKPALAMFLVTVLLWLFSYLLGDERRRRWWFLAGVIFGLACLTRGNLLLVTPVIVLWLAFRNPGRRENRRRLLESGTWLAGLALVLAVPAAHNTIVGGEFILTTANAGANFYIGNNPGNDTGEYLQLPFIRANPKYEQLDFKREAERRAGRELDDRDISAFWFAESWRWLRHEPQAWAGLLWSKLRAFWGAFEIPDSVDYYLYREFAPVLRLPVPGFGLLAPLCLLGSCLALRRQGWSRLLLLIVGAYCLTVVIFFVFSRFRMVVAPALYILAAHGVVETARRYRTAVGGGFTRYRPALTATCLFVLFWAFVNIPVRARADTLSFSVASAVGLPTRAETSMLGRLNLGLAYARKAKEATSPADAARWLAVAEEQLRRTLQIQGEHATVVTTYSELGKVLARQSRNREAIDVYGEAARLDPGNYRVQHALGILHRREGDREPAITAFRQALHLAPGHMPSAVLLGETLLEGGKPSEAEQVFRRVLQFSPDNARAQRGLAEAMTR